MNIPNARALLLLDGHTSRLQYDLWKCLAQLNIDALVLPSHTSQDLQPLDRTVNGEFKYYLQDIKGMPKKKEMTSDLKHFIFNITDCMYKCLNPKSIKCGFYKAHLMNPQYDIAELNKEIEEYITKEIPESCHLGVFNFFII
jgi:hypothetical protein